MSFKGKERAYYDEEEGEEEEEGEQEIELERDGEVKKDGQEKEVRPTIQGEPFQISRKVHRPINGRDLMISYSYMEPDTCTRAATTSDQAGTRR